MRFPIISALLFILCAKMAIAQRLDFTHLSVENGLSQKSVLAIAQDSRGFLWFGTANGLNRYDSRTFKTYLDNQNTKGLSAGYILSLFSDSQHNLWVGTSNGLNIYRPQTDDLAYIKLPEAADGTNTHSVNCITEDKNKRMWIGTTSGLYVLANKAQHKALAFFKAGSTALSGNNIHTIIDDGSGNMWVGTDKGLTLMKPQGNTFLYETFHHQDGQAGSLTDDNISSLAIDANHSLWIGLHEKGLDCFNAAVKTFTHYANSADPGSGTDNIRKIIADGNKLWLGTQDGLSTFDISTHQYITYKHNPDNAKSLNQNSIYSLFLDKYHTLWIGTYFGGVNIATSPMFNVYQTNNTGSGISSNIISSIVEDRHHNLWVGTEGGGLNYIHQPDKKITVYQHQKNNRASISSSLVKIIYMDKDGNMWVGTHGGGLNVFVPGKNSFVKYLYNETDADIAISEVRAIAEGTDGLFWVGTNTGLKIFKRNNNSLTPLSNLGFINKVIKDQPVNSLLSDSKGTLWIGSWGLFILSKNSKSIVLFQHNNMFNTRINCIMEDATGNLWVGTDTRGLFKYNGVTKQITKYTEAEGLANNNVYGIVQDKGGNIWISTANGLSGLNIKTGIFHNYTGSDGLAGNEFNKNSYTRLANGEILFGGFNGFTGFYPEDIKENTGKPAAFITGLKLFNKPVTVGDSSGILSADISMSEKITLKYTQNIFTINFVILNYIRAKKNRYAYQIQNIDKNWNYTAVPSVTYNNLPPGQYRFLARGQNNDGTWSDAASVLITVQPPWWRTWWAYSLYLLLFTAVIFLIVRFFFMRALLRRDQELTLLKLNFFTNISHEIRTYLSLISGPVEKLLMYRTVNDDDTQQLQTVKKNAGELLQLVNELMDFRKAETGNLPIQVSCINILPFVQSICQSFQEVAVEKNITTDLISSATETHLYFDKEQMKKVLFNLLSNAYKFTSVGGRVSIVLQDNNDYVNIKVADNGKGISPENIEKLFNNYFQENDYGQQNTGYGIGLALSKSIVALHKGELTVESYMPTDTADMTTVFTIKLKKGHEHFFTGQLVTESFINNHVDIERDSFLTDVLVNSTTQNYIEKKYTVLVVEDNPEVRKFVVASFSNNYHILEAANGQIGFEIATGQIPDVIISDVMMPEMDGYTFCGEIKADERTNHIPVILLTAKASVPNQVNGLEKGADVYLTKPFSIQLLTLQVQNLIDSTEKLRKRFSGQLIALPTENLPVIENEFIHKIIALAEEQVCNPNFDVEMICRHVAMSQTVLYRKIKALTDLTLNDIVKEVRFKKAAQLIQEQKYTVYEVADMVGYNDTKYFSREFKRLFGVSPRDYKMK